MPKIWYRVKGWVIGKLYTCEERCECGSGMRPHFKNGDPSCELWNHCCEMCHELKICTSKKHFDEEPPVTQASPETRAMLARMTEKWPVN